MLAAALAPRLYRHGIHYGWVMVGLIMLMTICSSAAVSLSGVLILPITEEFSWSRSDVSVAMGLMFATFAATAPFAGALILKFGIRRMVTTAAVTTAVALVGTTLISESWHLLITLGLLLGTAAGMVALSLAATVAGRWFTKRRGLAMGVLTSAFAAGQLTFLPLAAWLATEHGWRMAVLPAICAAGVCAVLFILFVRDWPADVGIPPYGEDEIQPVPPKPSDNVAKISFTVLRDAVGTKVFWVLGGTFFICGLSTSGLVNQHFIPFCADYGVTAVTAASFLAMIGIFNFIGTICSGWLSDRFDNRYLLAWYYALRGIALIWLPMSNFDVVSLSIFAVFFGLDYVATVPPTVKLVTQHFGLVSGPIVFGWCFAAHQAGGAVSAYLSGVGRDLWLSYAPVYFVVGATCLVAALVIFTIRSAPQEPLPA